MKKSEDNPLEKLYKKNGINLKEKDTQYNKYGLLTIDDNFTIFPSNLRVLDKRIKKFHQSMPNSKMDYFNNKPNSTGKEKKKYLLIEKISEDFLSILSDLRNKGDIKSLALNPNKDQGSNYENGVKFSFEELEYGQEFSFENLSTPLITKLYSSDNYENQLWINIDGKNITFEEMRKGKDFQTDEENIITPVIHLEYFQENDNYFISHLDHEFIFYTREEHEKRKNNPAQKGEAKPREKTFKIDNSRIPFTLEKVKLKDGILRDNIFFLYVVLDEYFENKDLLKEYFQKVLDEESA
jgi:hypothetical protein